MDSIAKPSVADKSASLVNSKKDNVDLSSISELAPNIRNTSMPEVAIASGSCLPVCLVECGKCGLRDIQIDDSVPSEDKVPISSDDNIYSEKQSTTNGSFCSRSGLESNECTEEDQYLSGHDWDGFDEDGLSCSPLKNIAEYEREIGYAYILKSLNTDGENTTSSSKENKEIKPHGSAHCFDECISGSTILEKKENISEHLRKKDEVCDEKRCNLSISDSAGLEGKFETSSAMQTALLGTFVENVVIVPDDKSSKIRETEVDFPICCGGDHDRTITSTINRASESFDVEEKVMKDRALSSKENAGPHLSNKLQTSRNPFAVEEEEKAQLNSYCASWESHLTASASLLTVQVSPKLLSEFTCSSKNEVIAQKAVDNLQMDSFLGKQVLSDQTLATAMDHKKIIEESCSSKCGNSIDSILLDKSMRISVSKSCTSGSHAANHMENQSSKALASSAFGGESDGEIRSDIPTQSIDQAIYDRSDKVNANHSAAEMSVSTHPGPNFPSGSVPCSGPLSARISYSGQIPFSGSTSHRSDSSTGSTHSFAFPILPNEWNSSPVKMKEADSKYFERKRMGWFYRFCCCFCCTP